MTSPEKILDKLGKIKAMAESAKEIGNEAEAQAFAAMLQQLLLKHKLEMTDIEYSAEMKEEPIIEHAPDTEYVGQWPDKRRVYKDFPDVEIVHRRRDWVESLARIVARAYSCQILIVKGSSIIYFVGHKSNVAIVEYLFLTMMRSAESMSDKAAKAFRRDHRAEHGAGNTPAGYRESWLEGFATRIASRLEEERAKFNTPTTCTALVRVNKEAIAVQSYVDDKFTRHAKPLGGASSFNRDGYEHGKSAANAIDIQGKAVKEGQANKQLS